MIKRIANTCFMLMVCCSINSCYKEVFIPAEVLDITGWTDETHANSTDPNYAVVFDQSKVHRLDIVLTSDEYNTMQDDLDNLIGSLGSGGGAIDLTDNPVYVAADVFYNNIQWFNVGVRYKGNSSLVRPYNEGIGKLPLRLRFDQFEDDYPEIMDQRFYGFKDLSLSSNFDDESFMREKAASDIFREFGVPSARTAFYEVYLDYGNGPDYLGLYTMVEVVFNSMLDDVFGSDEGNCYKPDGEGAKFSTNGFNLVDFEKKTNELEQDYTDIQELYDILHAENRLNDFEAWKADLESVFDVDGFLKYLAANNTIQNWDTYGNMTHNYYLYHDPEDDLIKWIVWDNNEAFQSTGRFNPLSFEMDEVNDDWPLISYLVDIAEYRERYDAHIEAFIEDAFLPSNVTDKLSAYNDLIYESATSEIPSNSYISSESDYINAVSNLSLHSSSRIEAATSYIE